MGKVQSDKIKTVNSPRRSGRKTVPSWDTYQQ